MSPSEYFVAKLLGPCEKAKIKHTRIRELYETVRESKGFFFVVVVVFQSVLFRLILEQ